MAGMLLLLVIVLAGWLIYHSRIHKQKQRLASFSLPGAAAEILEQHVTFYRQLLPEEQVQFRERIRGFLANTAITGVAGVVVEDLDRVLVAASAIIPIFGFEGWGYNNIDEVLLYKGTFSKDYQTEGAGRNVLGMVGSGALHRQMILSQPALREGFLQKGDGQNTGIHEFVHLLDKADGATDGLPEYLLDKTYSIPWLQEMHKQIQLIREGDSEINPYAATNEAEFLAVVSEYFFEKPEQLEEKHPQLYSLLYRMFHPLKS